MVKRLAPVIFRFIVSLFETQVLANVQALDVTGATKVPQPNLTFKCCSSIFHTVLYHSCQGAHQLRVPVCSAYSTRAGLLLAERQYSAAFSTMPTAPR